MAADDESTRATRQIYLPDISILEEIVNSTTGLFHNNEEEAICRVSRCKRLILKWIRYVSSG